MGQEACLHDLWKLKIEKRCSLWASIKLALAMVSIFVQWIARGISGALVEGGTAELCILMQALAIMRPRIKSHEPTWPLLHETCTLF